MPTRVAAFLAALLPVVVACGGSRSGGPTQAVEVAGIRYPANAIMCAKTVTTACASAAAGRAGHPIAYKGHLPGYSVGVLAVLPGGHAIEAFSSSHGAAQIQSPPIGEVVGTQVRRVVNGSARGVVYLDAAGGGAKLATVRWQAAGQSFELDLTGRGASADAAINAWRGISYAR